MIPEPVKKELEHGFAGESQANRRYLFFARKAEEEISFAPSAEVADLLKEVGADLFAWVRSTGASEAVTDCPLCEVQIADGTGVRTAHPVEVLARAYGTQ